MSQHSDIAKQVFKTELSWIEREDIKQFVYDVFDRFGHDFFWTRPASLSGKFHPKVSQGNGGLIRHVRLACFWGKDLNRAHLMGTKEKGNGRYGDLVIAALILHDLMKEGDPTLASEPDRMGYNGNRVIGGCHGVDLANAIWNRMLGQKADPDIILILYGIAGHMGPWTTPIEYQPNNLSGELVRAFSQVVFMADYASSRKVDEVLVQLNAEVPGAPTA